MHNFRVGDKVSLIISPQDVMTVCSVFGHRLIECTWVGKEGKVYKHSFRPESLQPANDTDIPQSPGKKNDILKIDDDLDDDIFNF